MPQFVPQHTPQGQHLDQFTIGYLESAEWLLPEADAYPDSKPPPDCTGFAPESTAAALADCMEFQCSNGTDLAFYYAESGRGPSSAGTDFYLSRNRHGAGFFDRGDHPVFKRLQEAARSCGPCDAYVGDDGLIYFT